MLKVIEYEKHWSSQRIPQMLFQCVKRRLTSAFLDSQCLSDQGSDQARIGDRRKGDKVDSGWKLLHHFLSHLQAQARLAYSTGTCKGYEEHILTEQDLFNRRHFFAPAKEGRPLYWQLVGTSLQAPG